MKDMTGITEKLQRSPNLTAEKRDLYRARRRREREYPGRWFVTYLWLKENGKITETGTGKRGDPIITTLVRNETETQLDQLLDAFVQNAEATE